MADRSIEHTSIKIPSGLLNSIDNDIETTHDFRNRSEWIIAAIREYIKIRTNEINERNTAFKNETLKGGGEQQ